jgi:hypothetical protein
VWAEDTLDALYVCGQGVGVGGGQRWLVRPVNDTARLRALELLAPIPGAQKGAASGVASLDGTGKVPTSQLPAGTGGVDSVNGHTGVVVLGAADVSAPPTTRKVTGIGPYLSQTATGALSADVGIIANVGTTSGTLAAGDDARFGTTGTSPRPVYAVVLSADAPADRKAAAASDPFTWVCDGTADQVQVQAAVDAAAPLQSRNAGMPVGAGQLGLVQLSGGRFNFSAGVNMRTAVRVSGGGYGTEIVSASCNSTGLFKLANPNEHLCQITDMTMNGNGSGTCSAVDFDMTASGNTSGYIATNPDSYHYFASLYLTQFTGAAGRNGIKLWATGTANNRGNRIEGVKVRDATANGIYLSASSDTRVQMCEIGGCDIAYNIATGNTTIVNSKSYYSDTAGFYFSSGRGLISGCDSQDDEVGFYFDAAPYTASGITADSPNQAGIRVSTSDLVCTGFAVFSRGGPGSTIRFPVSQRGIWYDATYSRCTILGNVKPSTGITANTVGTAPTGNVNVVTT